VTHGLGRGLPPSASASASRSPCETSQAAPIAGQQLTGAALPGGR
jgi:hypothetical protein